MVQVAVVLDKNYAHVDNWKCMPFIYVSSRQKCLKGEWSAYRQYKGL